MNKIVDHMTLTVNLNDDMIRFAIEKGYKLPCVSIDQHMGQTGKFTKYYNKNGDIIRYELEVCDRITDKWTHLYLIPV